MFGTEPQVRGTSGPYNDPMARPIFIAALVLSGCASTTLAPTGPFNKEVTIALGKSAPVVDGVSVRFLAVSGDSRCPADALCIQGGDAVVKLQVTSANDTREVELHTGNTQPITSGNLTVELLQLMPYPFSGRTIQPEEYRATIRMIR
jgi:hypothetical protein